MATASSRNEQHLFMLHMGPECQEMPGCPWKREGNASTDNDDDQMGAHGG